MEWLKQYIEVKSHGLSYKIYIEINGYLFFLFGNIEHYVYTKSHFLLKVSVNAYFDISQTIGGNG